jgi:hypothetical protein
VQAQFRAHVRVSWCGEHVVTANDNRTFVDGYGERLVVCRRSSCAQAGQKAAVSEALKNAFLGLALIVVYENATTIEHLKWVYILDDAFAAWGEPTAANERQQ